MEYEKIKAPDDYEVIGTFGVKKDGNKRIVMPMPEDDIPKIIAKGWLRELGIRG